MPDTADVVICGAGIAGIAAAFHLTQAGVHDVLLVEAGEPLSLTSDKSTECYRNFWPGPGDGMVRLMNRSLDLLDELAQQSGNAFHLNRRGYLYCTADPIRLQELQRDAEESSLLGAGPVRLHPGHPETYSASATHAPTDGFDILCGAAIVRLHYPFLSKAVVGALHVRRAGWFSAQQLGQLLLEQARARGASLVHGQLQAVTCRGGRIESIDVATPAGTVRIAAPAFVNAAGPWLGHVAQMVGVDLPVYCELHAKVSIPDAARAMPRNAPLVILDDPQTLDWSIEERTALREAGREALLQKLPSGLHARPEGPDGSPMLLALWPYHTPIEAPSFPLEFDPMYAEVVLRGLEQLLPGARAYRKRMPRAFVDGGYYTRTRENRPLIGPLDVQGVFVLGALSGFGLMAAMGAGELLTAHVTGSTLPEHSRWFVPARYADPAYQAGLATIGATGQL
jgi:glycine/D-amino acid oxidase-like deaminating enzyme